MSRVHTNNYSDSLNGAITNVQTTITVNDDTGLPSISGSDTYNLTISYGEHSEIVTVTDDTSTPTLTVTRGAEGTSARAFYDGSIVELNVTADSLDRKPDKAAAETISGDYTFTGAVDASGATEFLIPTSATPTVDADGEMALDTSVTDWSHSIPKIYGGEELGIVTMPIAEFTSPADQDILRYNATNDELELHSPSKIRFSVYRNAAQSVNDSTFTKVEFDSETEDIGGYFDSTTNYRFTPLVAGRYLFIGAVQLNGIADQAWTLAQLFKNGSSLSRFSSDYASGTSNVSLPAVAFVDMNGSTDYIELFVYHEHGSSRSIQTGAAFTFLTGILIEEE